MSNRFGSYFVGGIGMGGGDSAGDGEGGIAGVSSINGKTGRVFLSSVDIRYVNSGTGLKSTNIQSAINELKILSDSSKINVSNIESTLEGIINGSIDIDSSSDCEGQVRVNALDELEFLDKKVDDKTIKVVNDKLVAKSLDGLDASIDDLNMTFGAKSNIQAQLNALSQVGSFVGAVDNRDELERLEGSEVSDTVIVIEDEAHGGGSTINMYDGRNWVYVGEFKIEVRDFSTNPLDLNTESIGILPQDRVDLEGVVFDTDLDLPMVNKITDIDGELYFDGRPISKDSEGESNEVDSVNGKKGTVVLDHDDVGAIANILDTCSGIQIGMLADRPTSTTDNLLYIVMDKQPNEFYRYDEFKGEWDKIGSSMPSGETGEIATYAIEVAFDSSGSDINSVNLQELGFELYSLIFMNKGLIEDNKKLIDSLEIDSQTLKDRVRALEEQEGLDSGRVERLESDNITNKSKIGGLEASEGMVKSKDSDVLGYLDTKVDGTTIAIQGNKLNVKTIEGLKASVEELNFSRGVKSSVQAQIDNLTSIGNFTGSTEFHSGLDSIEGMINKDMVIVVKDETRDDITTIYMYDGTSWIFVSDFNVEVRDFGTDPIDINAETVNILAKDRVEQRDFDIDKLNINTQTTGVLEMSRIDTEVISREEVSVPTLTDFKTKDGKLMYGDKQVNLNPSGDHRLAKNEF